MSSNNNLEKRHISAPPHGEGFFAKGEFVYDPDAEWEDLRSGMVVYHDGTWSVTFGPKAIKEARFDEPLANYPGRLGRHILIDSSGIGSRRGPQVDTAPWQKILDVARRKLRDADGRRVRLDTLREELRTNQTLDPDLIDDTLRMFASMGFAKVSRDVGGFWYGLSALVEENFLRKDYLTTFSDEILAKSRRIDHLIRHTGTVGSYREELLRGTIRQLLPTRFEASTGFIESSPRQLDIIIWDKARYAPLFREQEVVVVPREAVRGIIEVKTTLDTGTLDDALEILYDVLRVDQPPFVPVFKGIFAFHQGYKSDIGIAERIREFHHGTQADGLITREHRYLFQGVTAVCVPQYSFVFQRYVPEDDGQDTFPKPVLFGLESDWPGDVQMAAFLSQILDHLDVEPAPKRTLVRMFQPLFSELKTEKLLQLFDKTWRPTLAAANLGQTLTASGAREYVRRVELFFRGAIDADSISTGLETNRAG
jgi:hypothetical protein